MNFVPSRHFYLSMGAGGLTRIIAEREYLLKRRQLKNFKNSANKFIKKNKNFDLMIKKDDNLL